MIEPDVLGLKDELVQLRRTFHMYPEIEFELHRTSKLVADYLESIGLEVKRNIARTGVVALLKGNKPGKTLMLRADMDALPLQELNDVPYKSKIDGAMHSCGHDGHTAMLLVAAKVLASRKDRIAGNIKFVFQPSEERFPPGGAIPMIEEGVLENPKVDMAFGIHLWNALPVGTVGLRAGPLLAAADEFKIILKGKGGHGAYPHACRDPIVAASELVLAFQTVVSRSVDPLESAVVTVGKLQSGTAFNIIPETAILEGTVRTLNEQIRGVVKKRMERIIRGVCEAHEIDFELDYKDGTAVLINDAELTKMVRKVAEEVVGKENVVEVPPSMGGEDMSFFLQKVPGVFYLVGSANPAKGLDKPHHSPYFDIDEDALLIGTQMHVSLVMKISGEDA
ncbi:M20 metallopeptidase family protein [Pseudothermotoga sp.]|nr:M20 family metallopeptidase [Pseudothermotoga sp.]MCX7812239.1 M20 family metallopeptidase [Pseudothermotoga sp.]MDW8139309.1 M20 family metallopeptidase [Pseudothermotoga sp.]